MFLQLDDILSGRDVFTTRRDMGKVCVIVACRTHTARRFFIFASSWHRVAIAIVIGGGSGAASTATACVILHLRTLCS